MLLIRNVLKTLLAMVSLTGAQAADEDLRELATKECRADGIAVSPPTPWYSVPIESGDLRVAGCQMIWEKGEQYMGIMRLVSLDTRELPNDAPKWENILIAFESQVIEQMNFSLGEPIWKRSKVPVHGEGFSNGKAIGFSVSLEGVTHQNEVHFLVFEGPSRKYAISLITPTESASPEIYKSNTEAMASVMRALRAVAVD
jgi:hypothetical protein